MEGDLVGGVGEGQVFVVTEIAAEEGGEMFDDLEIGQELDINAGAPLGLGQADGGWVGRKHGGFKVLQGGIGIE